MVKHERLPPKKRAASGSALPAASPRSTPASLEKSNPFIKRDRADATIALAKPSGTRNKNSGFDGISKRKRVRLDKREKKKAMALAGKLKGGLSKEAPSVPLELRAKNDAAKERERKKRQKLKKKRMQLALAAVSSPTSTKKRRSRSQVAADAAAAAAAAAANGVTAASPSPISSKSTSMLNSTDSKTSSVLDSSVPANQVPSKKMLRKLLMKEKRNVAKSASKRIPTVDFPQTESFEDKSGGKKRIRELDSVQVVDKKHPAASEFPYQVDSSDHAETPAVAYADVVPVLSSIAASIGKSHGDLVIFDPFYCQGSVRSNLASLGFTNVINKKQDFYSNPIPEYDVLLTNPPYSGDHLDRIVRFAAGSSKPWLLLLPNFVVGRSSYAESISKLVPLPFYVVPAVRYAYIVPSWVGARATAPFPSFWYAHCAGPLPPPLAAAAAASSKMNVRVWRSTDNAQPLYIEDIKALPQDVRDVTDPLKKRPNPRARKRMSASGGL